MKQIRPNIESLNKIMQRQEIKEVSNSIYHYKKKLKNDDRHFRIRASSNDAEGITEQDIIEEEINEGIYPSIREGRK